jgi:hypothetical protein
MTPGDVTPRNEDAKMFAMLGLKSRPAFLPYDAGNASSRAFEQPEAAAAQQQQQQQESGSGGGSCCGGGCGSGKQQQAAAA